MFKSKLINKAYWFIDNIKGKKVSNHLKDINEILNNPNSIHAIKIRKTHLENLLNHAVKTTPFYKSLKNTSLELFNFPVIKKTLIQNNFDQFQSHSYKNKKNHKIVTSGSTGIPFFLFQDKNKVNRNKADVIYFFKQCNFNIGYKLYNLAIRIDKSKKGDLRYKIRNVVPINITKLTDKKINIFLNRIINDTNNNKSILSYVSALETITKYLKKNKVDLSNLKLNSIITYSEYLSSETKKVVGNYFNTQVLARYSSEEVGIIAHQTKASPNNFIINHASYFVELLNLENDSPAKPGEFGRIIVTDLFNYAMPLIRYDTGDIAKLDPNKKLNQFKDIEGRQMDLIYDTEGNILSSHIVYTKFYKYYDLLKQYQFIQQDKNCYEVKLNLQNQTFDFEKELIDDIKKDFGENAKVSITYVDEIPTLSSGKRKKVVNNYLKKSS